MRWSNGIVSEIMKIIDEREPQAKNKQKQNKKQRQERTSGTKARVNGWELNYFVVRLRQIFSN